MPLALQLSTATAGVPGWNFLRWEKMSCPAFLAVVLALTTLGRLRKTGLAHSSHAHPVPHFASRLDIRYLTHWPIFQRSS